MTAIPKPLTDAQRRALVWARSITDDIPLSTLRQPHRSVLDRLRDAKLIAFDARGTNSTVTSVNITNTGRAALITHCELADLTAGQLVRMPYGHREWLWVEWISDLIEGAPRRRLARAHHVAGRRVDPDRSSYAVILHDYTYAVRGTL
jgi:hypothetical protein